MAKKKDNNPDTAVRDAADLANLADLAQTAGDAAADPVVTEDPAAQQTGQQVRLRIDERDLTSSYANAFRTNGTAEEVILDFGMNLANPAPQGEGQMAQITFKINERVIMNYHSAKRLAITLGQMIRRHEEQFGELEMDVAKRRKNGL